MDGRSPRASVAHRCRIFQRDAVLVVEPGVVGVAAESEVVGAVLLEPLVDAMLQFCRGADAAADAADVANRIEH